MAFIQISDPRKRDEIVQDYINTKHTLRERYKDNKAVGSSQQIAREDFSSHWASVPALLICRWASFGIVGPGFVCLLGLFVDTLRWSSSHQGWVFFVGGFDRLIFPLPFLVFIILRRRQEFAEVHSQISELLKVSSLLDPENGGLRLFWDGQAGSPPHL